MSEPHLVVDGITLRFGGTVALDDLSFSVDRGEMLSVVGPNGAGKTSVFNCITRFYKPAEGDIRFEGASLMGKAPHQVAALGIARTFQNVELFKMTVLENVLLGRDIRMRSGVLRSMLFHPFAAREEAEHRRRAEEILDFLGISHFRGEQVANLALGTQKLVEIGRALAMEPTLLLLDEPTAGMNRDEKEDVARFIIRIRKELGTTIVLIEHDMRFVMDLSDRVCVVSFGHKLAEGTPAEVVADQQVIDAYLGTSAARDD